jgi:hypothetical protein
MERTLTIAQARSTDLVNEVRSLKARLSGWVEVDVGVCDLDLGRPGQRRDDRSAGGGVTIKRQGQLHSVQRVP